MTEQQTQATDIDPIKQIALLAKKLLRADDQTARMVHPHIGDLVVETSWGPFDPDSVGILVEIEGDPVCQGGCVCGFRSFLG